MGTGIFWTIRVAGNLVLACPHFAAVRMGTGIFWTIRVAGNLVLACPHFAFRGPHFAPISPAIQNSQRAWGGYRRGQVWFSVFRPRLNSISSIA